MTRSFALGLGVVALAATAHAEPGVKLRVLSFNVWGVPYVADRVAARMTALPGAVAALGPDVVLLQEVWRAEEARVLEAGLRARGYPYTHHFERGLRAQTGLFMASRLPLEPGAFRPFSIGRLPHSFWHLDWLAEKGVAVARLTTPLGVVRVEDTHLQAQYVTDAHAPDRLAQATELALADALRGEATILGGDFNSAQSELPRRVVRDVAGFVDVRPDGELDTVYVRDGGGIALRVVDVREVLAEPVALADGSRSLLSDHLAVLVELELARSERPPPPLHAGPTRAAALASLERAADGTPVRVTLSLATSLVSLVGAAVAFTRLLPRQSGPTPRTRARRAGLFALGSLLVVGAVWSGYVGSVYFPARALSLRAVASALRATNAR